MGGHHHEEPFEVPHYTANTDYRTIPRLVEYEQSLTRIGLKDPWIRNYAYRYDPKSNMYRGRYTPLRRAWAMMKPGIIYAIPITMCVVAIEESYYFYTRGHTSWGGHH